MDHSQDSTSRKNYVVIESTPGYLPEDDDPPTFDQYAEALNYIAGLNKTLSEEVADDEGNPRYDVSAIVDGGFMYYPYGDRALGLGRVVQIEPLEHNDD